MPAAGWPRRASPESGKGSVVPGDRPAVLRDARVDCVHLTILIYDSRLSRANRLGGFPTNSDKLAPRGPFLHHCRTWDRISDKQEAPAMPSPRPPPRRSTFDVGCSMFLISLLAGPITAQDAPKPEDPSRFSLTI